MASDQALGMKLRPCLLLERHGRVARPTVRRLGKGIAVALVGALAGEAIGEGSVPPNPPPCILPSC